MRIVQGVLRSGQSPPPDAKATAVVAHSKNRRLWERSGPRNHNCRLKAWVSSAQPVRHNARYYPASLCVPCALGVLARDLYWVAMNVRTRLRNRSSILHSACILPLVQAFWNRCIRRHWPTNWKKRGLRVTCQQAIPVIHEAIRIDTGFHADLVVESKSSWMTKSGGKLLHPSAEATAYLKLADKRLGLSHQLNVVLIKNGITRIVNRLPEDPRKRR